jgi:hypothetical protein
VLLRALSDLPAGGVWQSGNNAYLKLDAFWQISLRFSEKRGNGGTATRNGRPGSGELLAEMLDPLLFL